MLCNKLPPCNPKIRGSQKKSGDRGEPQEYRLQLPLDMRWIIEPTRIEGRRDHGTQELDGAQGVGGCGHGVGLEGGTGDLSHTRLVLHDPIADPVPDLRATPLHTPVPPCIDWSPPAHLTPPDMPAPCSEKRCLRCFCHYSSPAFW